MNVGNKISIGEHGCKCMRTLFNRVRRCHHLGMQLKDAFTAQLHEINGACISFKHNQKL